MLETEVTKYIVDSEYLYSYDMLVKDLIEEVKRDTLENKEDQNIVSHNMDLLEKIYIKRNNSCYQNEEFIIKELDNFGYSIIRIRDIKDSLLILRDYLNMNNYETLAEESEHLRQEITDIMNSGITKAAPDDQIKDYGTKGVNIDNI